jgi:hypothetical protein
LIRSSMVVLSRTAPIRIEWSRAPDLLDPRDGKPPQMAKGW